MKMATRAVIVENDEKRLRCVFFLLVKCNQEDLRFWFSSFPSQIIWNYTVCRWEWEFRLLGKQKVWIYVDNWKEKFQILIFFSLNRKLLNFSFFLILPTFTCNDVEMRRRSWNVFFLQLPFQPTTKQQGTL